MEVGSKHSNMHDFDGGRKWEHLTRTHMTTSRLGTTGVHPGASCSEVTVLTTGPLCRLLRGERGEERGSGWSLMKQRSWTSVTITYKYDLSVYLSNLLLHHRQWLCVFSSTSVQVHYWGGVGFVLTRKCVWNVFDDTERWLTQRHPDITSWLRWLLPLLFTQRSRYCKHAAIITFSELPFRLVLYPLDINPLSGMRTRRSVLHLKGKMWDE